MSFLARAAPATPLTARGSIPWGTILLIGSLLLLPIVFLVPTALWLEFLAFWLFAWGLPGILLARLWRLPDISTAGLGLIAFGLGLCWLILFALIIHWLPGPVTRWQLLGVYAVAFLVLIALSLWRSPQATMPAAATATLPRSFWQWGLLLLLIAVLLRLPGLGYHEFHADEVVLLRQAARSIEGREDALAEHTKGPGEITITLGFYRALGTATETTARLPFALMSVVSILATAWLGWRLFSPTLSPQTALAIGFGAGLLLALNGFALGLSRIAQYQPALLLFSVLAVWAGWEFAQRGQPRWLALTALLSAFGLVMHYEFTLLSLVLLYLLWRGWQRTNNRPAVVRTILACTLAGSLFLAAVYIPAILNPYFARTQGYLSNRLGEIGTFNIPFFVEMGTFYNSIYFFAGLLMLASAGTILGWRQTRHQTVILTLWWLPFFILYIFIVRFPGTHFYLLMESWSLLAAIPLALLWTSSSRNALLRWGAIAALLLWLLVSTYYLYLLFFRQQPEYLVNYDKERVSLYWAPFPVPEKPRFGFPIQEGWKTLGVLGKWGYLQHTYANNDDAWSLRRWYLQPYSKRYFDESPDYIFVARHLQERNLDYNDFYEETYHRVGEVRVREEPRIEIWAREPLPVPYVTYNAEDFAPLFPQEVAALEPAPDSPSRIEPVALGDQMTLASAHLDRTHFSPGDTLHLLLVWQPQQPLAQDYKLFVHVADEQGQPVAQWDGLPGLNTARTSQWPVGEDFRDHVLLKIPDDAPPGTYTLLAGLYDGATGDRLGDAAIPISTVTIR